MLIADVIIAGVVVRRSGVARGDELARMALNCWCETDGWMVAMCVLA